MISYFSSGYLIKYLVVLFISTIIWLPSFFLPQSLIETRSIFSLLQYDINWIGKFSILFIFIAYFLTLFAALALNQILREYDLIGVNDTTGLAVYIIFVSALPLFTSINYFIIINVLLIIFIQNLLKLSTIENSVSTVFNASFFLGIASLFYIPLLYLLVLIWIAGLINRHLDLRNLIVSIAGTVLPYFFVFTWFFWNNTAHENGIAMLHMLNSADFLSQTENYDLYTVILVSILGLIILTSFLVTLSKLNEMGNFLRKNFIIGIYFLLLSTIIVLFYHDGQQVLLLLGLPAAIVVSTAVYLLKKSRLFNIYFALLLIGVLLYQYYQLFYAKEVFFR